MTDSTEYKCGDWAIWDSQVAYLWEQRQLLEKEFKCEIVFSGGKMNTQNNWEVTILCSDYDVISLLDIKMINYQNELSNELQQPLGCLLVLKY